MAVNFPLVTPAKLKPVPGITLGYAEAGIKKPNRKDLLVMQLAASATVAGVFTTNRFCAAPVQLAKAHIDQAKASGKPISALVINTGNANAGTGAAGLANAQSTCDALGKLLGVEASQVLPFSTGVILEPLPVDKVVAGLPQAIANLGESNWYGAAQAIMTTDTLPKAASRTVTISGKKVTLTGISKGAGMIRPNMATMLGFIACDAKAVGRRDVVPTRIVADFARLHELGVDERRIQDRAVHHVALLGTDRHVRVVSPCLARRQVAERLKARRKLAVRIIRMEERRHRIGVRRIREPRHHVVHVQDAIGRLVERRVDLHDVIRVQVACDDIAVAAEAREVGRGTASERGEHRAGDRGEGSVTRGERDLIRDDGCSGVRHGTTPSHGLQPAPSNRPMHGGC